MEMKKRKELFQHMTQVFCGCLLLNLVLSCCNTNESEPLCSEPLHASHYPLITITPDFNIQMEDDTLFKRYPRFQDGKDFPFTGVLQVDGKFYRFMGGDSQRPKILAPFSYDGDGWVGKYTYVYPGKGWEQTEYDDSQWKSGQASFGTPGVRNVNTLWASQNIYVRRTITLDKDSLKGRKLFVYYSHDDDVALYLNGKCLIHTENAYQSNARIEIPEEILDNMKNGENLLAAHCNNKGGGGMLDFGIYIENSSNQDMATALFKNVDVQATQTHYAFQCGGVELTLDFMAPFLSDNPDLLGSPVNTLAYQIKSLDGNEHSIEISFDLDAKLIFGKTQTEIISEKGWQIIQTGASNQKLFEKGDEGKPSWGYFYMGLKDKDAICKNSDGHISISQPFGKVRQAADVLFLGMDELYVLQYFGDNLRPYWNRDGKQTMAKAFAKTRKQYNQLKSACDLADSKWLSKALTAGGKRYAEHFIPSYRTLLATHRLAETPSGEIIYFNEVVGNLIGDQKFFSHLLFFDRTDLMAALLNPVFDRCSNERWPKRYPPHDLGEYPIAIFQSSENDRAVEVTSCLLTMTEAMVRTGGTGKYAERHWKYLSQWGDFLKNSINKNDVPLDTLLDVTDIRVKTMLGISAYEKLQNNVLK